MYNHLHNIIISPLYSIRPFTWVTSYDCLIDKESGQLSMIWASVWIWPQGASLWWPIQILQLLLLLRRPPPLFLSSDKTRHFKCVSMVDLLVVNCFQRELLKECENKASCNAISGVFLARCAPGKALPTDHAIESWIPYLNRCKSLRKAILSLCSLFTYSSLWSVIKMMRILFI